MKTELHNICFYSPRTASRAFDPPCGEQTIRRAIKMGALKVIKVGVRQYLDRNDLIRAANNGDLR